MSDIVSMSYSANKAAGLSVYAVDDVGDGSIERAQALLVGIKHGAEKAIGSAIKYAAKSGEAHAAKVIRKEYFVSASDFKKYTKSKRRIVADSSGTTVEINYAGYHIPLLKFNTTVKPNGRVSVRVKRSSARTVLDHVFSSSVGSGHTGLYERTTKRRLPIEEKFGPSTPQMMDYNDDVSQEIGDHIREMFDKRIDHEILAVMNGWRA